MTRRMGWMSWLLIALLVITAALYGTYRYALATNAVGLLDWGDRLFGSSAGSRLALADGHYGPDLEHRVEVTVPAGATDVPRAVLVFFHGGGWHSGQPGSYRFVGRTFAREGYVVVTAGYRLGEDGRFPAMLEDAALAVAWVRDHAAEFGGDPGRIALMGHSAGAYSAVMLGLERQWLGRVGVEEGAIKAVVGLSGPYDFYPWTNKQARAAFGHAPDPAATQPINHVRGDAPPLLLLTGRSDSTVRPRNSQALARAMDYAGQRPALFVLDRVNHAGTVMKLAAPFSRDRRVLDPVLAFLARHLAASAPVQPAAS